MSEGLNKAFIKNPKGFMQQHVFNVYPDTTALNLNCQVHKFNIKPFSKTKVGKIPRVILTKANKERSTFSHAFNAYYLPWQQRGNPSIQLGTQAKYFFTAGITGCRLIINAGNHPRVTHVDGGQYRFRNQMDALCSTRSNGNNFDRQRYWDNGNYYATIVIGTLTGIINKRWKFFAQSFNKIDTPLGGLYFEQI